MAIMYPAQLSARVLSDRKLKGEIDTYNALSKLSDEFEIFYNRYVNTFQGSKAHKRRIDFIILHEKLGLLAMEVKGGKIRIGADGSIEQYHHTIKSWKAIDPYQQVERATIQLIKDCKANGVVHWIPDDTCVMFPSTLRRDITDTPQHLPNGTLCADDLPLLSSQIPTLFSKSKKERAWTHDAFLDMRRRLQSIPEANRVERKSGHATSTSSHKITGIKQKSESIASSSTRQFSNWQTKKDISYHPFSLTELEEAIFYDDEYDSVTYYPATNVTTKLKIWQILLAILAGLLIGYMVIHILHLP